MRAPFDVLTGSGDLRSPSVQSKLDSLIQLVPADLIHSHLIQSRGGLGLGARGVAESRSASARADRADRGEPQAAFKLDQKEIAHELDQMKEMLDDLHSDFMDANLTQKDRRKLNTLMVR